MAESTPTRQRSAFIDNARALLIVLVVTGHVMGNMGLKATMTGSLIYTLIYSFHMPAFAFVSGLIAKPNAYSRQGLRSTLRLLAVYFAFQVPLYAIMLVRSGESASVASFIAYPVYALWWLMSLITWQLALPLFARGESNLSAGLALAAAVTVTIVASLVIREGILFSVSRTVTFFPLYLAGYLARKREWALPRTVLTRALAVATFAGAVVALLQVNHDTLAKWLMASRSLIQLEAADLQGVMWRLVLMAAAGALTAAFLQLTPRRSTPLSPLGATTLSVYVWHALIVYALSTFKVFRPYAGSWLATAAVVAGLVIVLGYGPVARFTMRWIGGRPLTRTS